MHQETTNINIKTRGIKYRLLNLQRAELELCVIHKLVCFIMYPKLIFNDHYTMTVISGRGHCYFFFFFLKIVISETK